RRYACSLTCRGQLLREASGVRLGDIADAEKPAPPSSESDIPPVLEPRLASSVPPASTRPSVTPGPAIAIPTTPLPRAARAGGRERVAAEVPVAGGPRTIAVFSHKGGTGKTTRAVSVAAGLAARGKRVLLIDTDAQGNVAVSLDARSERSLYHVLVMGL